VSAGQAESISSGAVGLIACGWWVRQTLRGGVSQDRASWLIWSLAYGVLLAASAARGARATLWLNGAELASVALLSGLSWRRGTWALGRWSAALIACACAALAAWALTRSPGAALMLMLAVIASGSVPTLRKAWQRPSSEPALSWALLILAAALAALAIRPGSAVIMYGYPAVTAAMSTAVLAAMTLAARRPAHGRHGARRERARPVLAVPVHEPSPPAPALRKDEK
jgi:hypothetical protein